MPFFKRVNLSSNAGDQLSGWVDERYAAIGHVNTFEEDEFRREWRVEESGNQLAVESQVDPRHRLNPVTDGPGCPPTPPPKAVLRKPGKSSGLKAV